MIPNENFFFIRFATLFVAVYNKLAYEFRKNVRTINKRNFFYRCLSLVSLNYEKKIASSCHIMIHCMKIERCKRYKRRLRVANMMENELINSNHDFHYKLMQWRSTSLLKKTGDFF